MKLLYTLNERPSVGLTIVLAIQHLFGGMATLFHSGITTGAIITIMLNLLLPRSPDDEIVSR